jgi:hypothetical protein
MMKSLLGQRLLFRATDSLAQLMDQPVCVEKYAGKPFNGSR